MKWVLFLGGRVGTHVIKFYEYLQMYYGIQ